MQSEFDSKNSQPQESPSELLKREDSAKAKIHPEASPPQGILGETPNNGVTKNNENNPLVETPLSPSHQKVSSVSFSSSLILCSSSG